MEKEGYRDCLELLCKKYPNKSTLTVQEAAAEMGAGVQTVYRNLKAAKNPIPHQKLGGKVIIPITKFAGWLCSGRA